MFGPWALYLEMARLTVRAVDAEPPVGHEVGQDAVGRWPPTRSMTVSAMTPAAWMSWSRAACRAMVKLARSGSSAGAGVGGVGHGGAQDLVGDQQGVDLLVDAGRGAGAQHPAAEDGGFQFQVGGLDLPALVVEP